MVAIAINIPDVSIDEVDLIKAYFHGYDEAKITITQPWPTMTLGDEISYEEEVYVFLSYMNAERSKCKCVNKKEVTGGDTYFQSVYFDCSKISHGIVFL